MSFEELPLSKRDRALYGKLYVSLHDIGIARQAARFLKKKGWHGYTFMRRGSTEIQQIAHTTTVIVAYSRPFKIGKNKGVAFPDRLMQPYNKEEREMHKRLLYLRDKAHAHMDPESYDIRPLNDPYIKSMDMVPYTNFSLDEVNVFLSMTDGLSKRISDRMEEIHSSARSSHQTKHCG